ncbi:MAG: hypothetical protein ACI9HU_000627 [Colwellia sp.]|jgi:hypothetical protein
MMDDYLDIHPKDGRPMTSDYDSSDMSLPEPIDSAASFVSVESFIQKYRMGLIDVDGNPTEKALKESK